MITLIATLMMAASAPNSALCQGPSQPQGTIRWSESTKLLAPNRLRYVEVKPILTADENQSPVWLRSCRSASAFPLMVLSRSADVYWSSDSADLMIIDRPADSSYIVRVFKVVDSRSNLSATEVHGFNNQVRSFVEHRIPKGARIEFFKPRGKSWNGSQLTLEVLGTYSVDDPGPMRSFCFNAVIDSVSFTLRDALVRNSASKSKTQCRIS